MLVSAKDCRQGEVVGEKNFTGPLAVLWIRKRPGRPARAK
jgi:hypothetical protein